MATSNNSNDEQMKQVLRRVSRKLSSERNKSFSDTQTKQKSDTNIGAVQPIVEEIEDDQSDTADETITTNETEKSDKLIYMADYNYNSTTAPDEFDIRKGDRLEILDEYSNNEWWQAKNLRTNQVGYARVNHISALIDSTACEWYFTEINRDDAERYLELPHNGRGTFLIRTSDTRAGKESLSVLDFSPTEHFHVKHYRIRRDQGSYYIARRNLFPSLQDLVDHYRIKDDGLCCLLTHPCRKIEPTFSANLNGLLELDRSQILRTELLGQGNYDEVCKGTYGQRDVAIRFMEIDNLEKFLHEAKIMSGVLHENIVRFYGVSTEEDSIFIVTEFMTYGSLLTYLHYEPGKSMRLNTMIDFAAQIADGMAYLEEKQYVHCNLAARNIFVGGFDIVKIGDFGLAKIVQDNHKSQFRIKWTAPEITMKQEYTTKSDVWSFGILLYELITHGSKPYPNMSNNEVLEVVLNGHRMSKPDDCDDKYYEIMCSCWQDNPDDRPTFETLYRRFDEFMIQDEPEYQ